MKRRRLSLLLAWLTLALAGVLRCQKIELDRDIEMEIGGNLVGNTLVTFVTPFMGRASEGSTTSQRTSLILDTTFDRLLIADLTGSDYGLNCQPDLYCQITGPKDVCKYRTAPDTPLYDCRQGSVLLKFKESKVSDPNIAQIEAYFYNSTEPWVRNYGKQGVFGLSPSSPLWSYFKAAYTIQPGQDDIETSVAYRLQGTKGADPAQAGLVSSYFTVNGRMGINDPVVQRFNTSYSAWVMDGASMSGSPSSLYTKVPVCVDNTQHSFVLFKNSSTVLKEIRQKLCGRPDACLSSQSDLSKVDPMTFTIAGDQGKTIEVTVAPEEFVVFDQQGNDKIAIGDIGASKCGSVDSVGFAVGRLMLTKVEFIVRVTSSDKGPLFDVGFNEITYPNDTIFLVILIVLAVIILLIVGAIVIASSVAKKKGLEDSPDKYRSAESVET